MIASKGIGEGEPNFSAVVEQLLRYELAAMRRGELVLPTQTSGT